MAKQAAHLSGAVGTGRVDAETFKFWLLQFGIYSEKFWEEMAEWVTLLNNGSPAYAIYLVANSAHMLAVDKQSGDRPLVCGDIYMRLWGWCNPAAETKALVGGACRNI